MIVLVTWKLIFDFKIIKELRKVKVKAAQKKKPMEINDYGAKNNNGNLFGDAGNSEEKPGLSESQSTQPLTEEQRQKALDDMLC